MPNSRSSIHRLAIAATVIASFVGVAPAYADFYSAQRDLARAESERSKQDYFNNEVQMNRQTNSTIIRFMEKFAKAHGGLASAPLIDHRSYHNPKDDPYFAEYARERNPVTYELIERAYATEPRIDEIRFSTRDGHECRARLIGVDCVHPRTGRTISGWGLR